MMSEKKIIFHIDVNSAFLSWSALKELEKNPGGVDLRTIPSAVGGDVKTRHGVITAKSIPAKAYGVETGEPVVKALGKCPQLVLVRSDFAAYRKYSAAFISLLKEYTPQIQQVSIDEAYMDATGLAEKFTGCTEDFPLSAARSIKDAVKERLGFTVNVGISTNKFLAKMASDFQKPDRIHTLYPEEIEQKLWPLPIRDLYGCGAATAVRLQKLGILTIGDAAHAPLSLLQGQLGNKMGQYILDRANGLAGDKVAQEEREAKSYSNETTTMEDITASNYKTLMPPLLEKLSSKVAGRLQRDGVFGATVSVMVKTGSFQRHSRQKALAASTNDGRVIYSTCEGLLDELLFSEKGLFSQGEVLRLVGVGMSGLDKGEYRQMDLFSWASTNMERRRKEEQERVKQEKQDRADMMLKSLQDRFGEEKLKKGV